jgi:hypothetical protein
VQKTNVTLIDCWKFDPFERKLKGRIFDHPTVDIDPIAGNYVTTSTVLSMDPELMIVQTRHSTYKLHGRSIIEDPGPLLPDFVKMAEDLNVPVQILFDKREYLECNKCGWVHFRVYTESKGHTHCFRCKNSDLASFKLTDHEPAIPMGVTIQCLYLEDVNV